MEGNLGSHGTPDTKNPANARLNKNKQTTIANERWSARERTFQTYLEMFALATPRALQKRKTNPRQFSKCANRTVRNRSHY